MHDAVRPTVSVAVQTTFVEPTGNGAPLVGEQLTVTLVPVAMGVPYATGVGPPVGDVTVGGALGQVMVGGLFPPPPPPTLPPLGEFGLQAEPAMSAAARRMGLSPARLTKAGVSAEYPSERT